MSSIATAIAANAASGNRRRSGRPDGTGRDNAMQRLNAEHQCQENQADLQIEPPCRQRLHNILPDTECDEEKSKRNQSAERKRSGKSLANRLSAGGTVGDERFDQIFSFHVRSLR